MDTEGTVWFSPLRRASRERLFDTFAIAQGLET
jgi:hypothetical protein